MSKINCNHFVLKFLHLLLGTSILISKINLMYLYIRDDVQHVYSNNKNICNEYDLLKTLSKNKNDKRSGTTTICFFTNYN